MKPRFSIFDLLSSILWLSILCSHAQPQLAWVARYNGGFSNQNHKPFALKLDATGNLYIAGSSQNASNREDYVVLKYAPNGSLLYGARHSSTNGLDFTANGFALDQSGNTFVTGTGGTVKFDNTGALAWSASYAGRDVALDTNGNVYVTGFSTQQFATVKLSPTGGSNLWLRTYANHEASGVWRTESQKVAVDDAGHVFVAGWEAWGPAFPWPNGTTNLARYFRPAMLCYDTAGTTLWTNAYTGGGLSWGETRGLIPDNLGNVYITETDQEGYGDGKAWKIDALGQNAWANPGPGSPLYSMAVDLQGDSYFAGYATLRLCSTNGHVVWQNYEGSLLGQGIALDNVPNVYVAGITNTGTRSEYATLKYDNEGHRHWVLRYHGPANGDDGATAIAVAPEGSIYVTGYSANSSGGSDLTTLKYAPGIAIQPNTDGSMQLEGYGLPGSNYVFQATTHLLNWSDLGTVPANSNGIFEFLDTNAPLFPWRFYRWYEP